MTRLVVAGSTRWPVAELEVEGGLLDLEGRLLDPSGLPSADRPAQPDQGTL